MFERFTERARQIVILAQEAARAQPAHMITTGHLLLGLIREEEGLASRVLASLDVNEKRVLSAKGQWFVPAGERQDGQLPFTLSAKQALEGALREALSLAHNYIGTEHILLALIRVPTDSEIAGILAELGVEPESIRIATVRLLGAAPRPEPRSVVKSRRLTVEGDDIAVILWALATASCKPGPKAERAAQLLAVFAQPIAAEDLAGEVAALSAKLAVVVDELAALSHTYNLTTEKAGS